MNALKAVLDVEGDPPPDGSPESAQWWERNSIFREAKSLIRPYVAEAVPNWLSNRALFTDPPGLNRSPWAYWSDTTPTDEVLEIMRRAAGELAS